MADEGESSGRPPDEGDADRGVFARLADLGGVTQASVPGFYAWAVTVAPVAWAKESGLVSRGAAVLAALSLVAAIVLERRAPDAESPDARRARLVSVWGLVGASAVTWLSAPASVHFGRIDAARGISGMLGWGLFAYASAAPAYRRSTARPIFEGDELRPRATSPRFDWIYLALASLAAVALQLIGWFERSEERALLVRLVTLAASVAIVTQSAEVALARHRRERAASAASRRPAVFTALGAVAVVTVIGVVLMLVR